MSCRAAVLATLQPAACADTSLPLTQGPAGASGRLAADGARLAVTMDGTTCTARPKPLTRDAAQGPLLQAPLTCADGRRGTATLRPLPVAGYEGLLELPGLKARLTYDRTAS
ncbi:hypothetical protein [Sagittula salina]|uniref:Uncharacterized protein n=1 Tax=Sagittula salina TaxID=2820268 RepID=A0A940MR91_9RHOB|nr:hypothetical protein [Sagittula salina]MBP0483924.1 hypothetical protein [Sagittula salina]